MIKIGKSERLVLNVLVVLFFFFLGMLANNVTGYFSYDNHDSGLGYQEPIGAPTPKAMPGDWIGTNDINVYKDRVVIGVQGAQISGFSDTHSMEPVLGVNSNAIEIVPQNENQVNIGDVVVYASPSGEIIHRVVKKDVDENGTYFLVKGDNNPEIDPVKLRFNQIERVLVAIIY